jgi:hypothetical protein
VIFQRSDEAVASYSTLGLSGTIFANYLSSYEGHISSPVLSEYTYIRCLAGFADVTAISKENTIDAANARGNFYK